MGDPVFWLVFFSAALALNLSPGPDLLYVLSRTLSGGRRIGVVSACGVCSGALVHVAFAALGISAILATSALAFTVVKYVGAAYLLYLGFQALRSAGGGTALAFNAAPRASAWKAYRQGVLVDLLNPKAAIFFMAFLPQFVRPDHGSVPLQLLVLGVLVVVVAIIVEVALVLLAARATTALRNNPVMSQWIDRTLGSILIALGIRLGLAERL
ncbi:LysE family translocator [Stutzerimonas frequens]|uniref:LysE family translocator n=1 Tax=Stutzerimonas TaxID=2901164 RepID=UPI000F772C71|nr:MULTISPECIES: LysE family translocator [Stutzerimonas]MDA0425872.1 LysE family translocator [Stutzerimonas frequens]QTF55687.1 LysE family translocator [Stutzerimonas frequens]RRV70094.1 LysE family translocator [Stutzerimonas stutzeri]WAE60712.1 LysE family translocator [Stutzerimonas sp. R40042]